MKIRNFSSKNHPTNIILASAFLIVLSIPSLVYYVNACWPHLTILNFFESLINFSKACFESTIAMWVLFILGPLFSLGLLIIALWERKKALEDYASEFEIKFIDINEHGILFNFGDKTGKFYKYDEISQITLDVKTFRSQGKNLVSDIIYKFYLPGAQVYETHSVYSNPFKALKYLRKVQNIKVCITGGGGLEYNKKLKANFEYFIEHGKNKPLDKNTIFTILTIFIGFGIFAILTSLSDIIEFITLRF